MKGTRETWIDLAKCMAIIAVLIDHTYLILYSRSVFQTFSLYSVSLFVICMGITGYWGWKRRKTNGLQFILKRIWSITGPYLVATFIYQIFEKGEWGIITYLNYLIHFNASPPLYYVSLAIQLLIAVPVLATLVENNNGKYRVFRTIGIFCVLLVITWFTTNRTYILEIYGGGGVLLGGTFLLLLYLGMLIADSQKKILWTNIQLWVGTIVFFIIASLILWMLNSIALRIDNYLPFGKGFNPPSISLMSYAVAVMGFCYGVGKLLDRTDNRVVNAIFGALTWIGQHTLYIFLYHSLFIKFIIPIFNRYVIDLYANVIGKIFSFFIILVGPIAMEYCFTRIRRWMADVYLKPNPQNELNKE